MFAGIGVPQEILTDQGSNFTSQLLAELYYLMHIHPFHIILKLMQLMGSRDPIPVLSFCMSWIEQAVQSQIPHHALGVSIFCKLTLSAYKSLGDYLLFPKL